MVNKGLRRPKKDKYVRFKNYESKIKSLFMIYADFESILVPEDNRKQNPNKSYTKKYQKHVDWSYSYKLVCVDNTFDKSFKSFLGETFISNFINGMIKESKYCSEVTKNLLTRNLSWLKKIIRLSELY